MVVTDSVANDTRDLPCVNPIQVRNSTNGVSQCQQGGRGSLHIIQGNKERWLPNMLIRGDVEFPSVSSLENTSFEMPPLPIAIIDWGGQLDYLCFILIRTRKL